LTIFFLGICQNTSCLFLRLSAGDKFTSFLLSISPRLFNNSLGLLVGFGGGLTWGAMVVEWTGPLPVTKHVHPEQYRTFARLRSFIRRAIRFIEGFFSRKEL
jgi:hypothetical protein